MSNYLALATVTATLSQLIQDAIDLDVPGAGISTVRPDIAGNNAAEAKVNIYLYQVTTNTALRNDDLPTRRADGSLAQRPKVALDLHYLLTFYGDETALIPQRLMGSVVRTLHSEPQLTRTRISDKVKTLTYLQGSTLAEDPELVKFTPLPLSLEELSKLWSILIQTPYALSIIYLGTVVVIEGDELPRTALPVKAPQVFVIPFQQPDIEQLLSQKAGSTAVVANQAIVTGDALILVGKQLQSTDPTFTTQVYIGDTVVPFTPFDITQISPVVPKTMQALRVVIPDTLQAGVQGVQVVQTMNIGPLPPLPPAPATPHNSFESPIVPFVLRPTLGIATLSNVQDQGNGQFSATLTVPTIPNIASSQRAVLLLNTIAGSATPNAYSFVADAHPTETNELTFSITGVQSATYIIRLQVDGAENIVNKDTQQVSIA